MKVPIHRVGKTYVVNEGRSAIRAVFAPTLDDAKRTLGFRMELGFDPDYDIAPDMPGVYIKARRHSRGCVVSIDMTAPAEAQVVEAATQVQEVLCDDDQVQLPGRLWPPCPSHAHHALVAGTQDGRAVWRCDASSVTIPIGQLGVE